MCGFVGEFDFEGLMPKTAMSNWIPQIQHRGPDAQGDWSDLYINLGHARLSILDISEKGHQPMIDPENGNIIVYNGEIYNFKELRESLFKKGYKFYTECDTEVILKIFKEMGESCLHYLRGMFSFLIYIPTMRRVFFARDRVGKKPFYYTVVKNKFIFASELYALACHRDVSLELSDEAIETFFSFQCIPSPLTIYKNVFKLRKGAYGFFDNQGLDLNNYHALDFNKKNKVIQEKDVVEEAEKVIYDAVESRMVSDVPVGALLSGGVDSSLVVAMLSKASSEKVKTFSIGFSERSHSELPYAKVVSDFLETEHTELTFTSDMVLDMIPKVVRHYGEPYADTSCLPTFCVSHLTSSKIKVALTGDGGDEICAGYDHYQFRPGAKWINKLFGLRHVNFEKISEIMNKSNVIDKVRSSLLTRYLFPESRCLIFSNYFQGTRLDELLVRRNCYMNDWRQNVLGQSYEHAENCIERMLWIDNESYLPDDLLVKTDIASMAFGLELRSPLLDQEVVSFFSSIPLSLKVKGGESKSLLKKVARRWVPDEVLNRPKKGFVIPPWMSGCLSGELMNSIEDQKSALSNYLNIEYVIKLINNKNIKDENRLWAIFFFSKWLKMMSEIRKIN